MGIVLWLLGGVAAFVLARRVRIGRTSARAAELAAATVAALTFGALATALDFGGWRELDWRAALFAFVGAFGAIGLLRAVRR